MIDARPNVLRRSACARSAVLAYLEISGSELAALARISAEEIETFYDEAMSGRPRAASNLREMGDAGAALNTASTIAQERALLTIIDREPAAVERA